MRTTLVWVATVCTLATACIDFGQKVNGNGRITTETRHVRNASKIKLSGGMDVIVSQGPVAVKVETDENVLPYVLTDENGDWLNIRTKDNVNLHTTDAIKIYVTTPNVSNVQVTGSGNVSSDRKINSDEPIAFQITGSGDINFEVNCPKVKANITGSGNMNLHGETRDVEVHITGSGDYKGAELKAENAAVQISGSGDALVFADGVLKASVMGSGDVRYKGNARVDKQIHGSGSVEKAE